jgi:uncharacterized protein YifE (UPF0438 family)
MMTKQDHIDFRKNMKKFEFDLDKSNFLDEEIRLIEENYSWYFAMSTGKLKPVTKAQQQFVLAANDELLPKTFEEQTWCKYIGIKRRNTSNPERNVPLKKAETDTFYNREMVSKNRKQIFGMINKLHRE